MCVCVCVCVCAFVCVCRMGVRGVVGGGGDAVCATVGWLCCAVGKHEVDDLTHISPGNACPQSSELTAPLWAGPWLKYRIDAYRH